MKRLERPPIVSVGRVRFVAAIRRGGGYVVYDRWDARVADGRYLSVEDAQWAADQRNQTTTTRQIDEAC